MVKPIRRVVTGHDDRGRAVVVSDGPAPSVHINKAEQDWFSVDIWRTHEMPAKIVPKAVEEPTAGPRRQMPTTNGTVQQLPAGIRGGADDDARGFAARVRGSR